MILMNQIVVRKWTFPDGYHYKLEPPNTMVPNRKGGYVGLIQSAEWKVITQMWYFMSKKLAGVWPNFMSPIYL